MDETDDPPQGANWTGDISLLSSDTEDSRLRAGNLEGHLSPQNEEVMETADLLMSGDLFPAKRGFKRYDLSHREIPTRISTSKMDVPEIGRVRNVSINGVWIDTETPLPVRTPVRVQIPSKRRSVAFAGKVIRQSKGGMAIELATDDTSWSHRKEFVELAQAKSAEPLVVSLEVTKSPNDDAGHRSGEALDVLNALWLKIPNNLENTQLHQGFIEECCRHRRAEFALERYRELQDRFPSDARIKRCIEQITHILENCWVGEEPKTEQPPNQLGTALLAVATLSILGLVAYLLF